MSFTGGVDSPAAGAATTREGFGTVIDAPHARPQSPGRKVCLGPSVLMAAKQGPARFTAVLPRGGGNAS